MDLCTRQNTSGISCGTEESEYYGQPMMLLLVTRAAPVCTTVDLTPPVDVESVLVEETRGPVTFQTVRNVMPTPLN